MMASKHLLSGNNSFAEMNELIAQEGRVSAALVVKITGTFIFDGKERALGFEATGDDALNHKRLDQLMFAMRRTNSALLGLLGPETQAEVERLTA